ncbi:SAC3 family protein C isoform X3 [Camellia sinensis]|uniref:SAC3 family protein C isoform X3 n=1 Tax=Camellia sinensis TaxID=4442 RepID=UPI001035B005|nr:SAC3 family protein C isoform X3 [Camellia sinensis]
MRNATNSNPNPINNHDYSKRNTQQLQEEGEEDLLLSPTSIVGTCPFMCPVEERVQRERLRDLSVFERLNGSSVKTSPSLAVKKVKFHVISHHKLRRCSDSPNISSKYYLNMEQLTKALTSLYHLYEANQNIHSIYENEAEFRSLYVLLHLGCDNKPMGESLSFWFCHVASPIIKSKEMCFARIVLRYYRFGNYKRFICTTAAEASYLQYCIIEPYINKIRVLAVSCVNFGGYKLHPYPLADLSKLLMMKESDVESFCHDCGLETSTDEVGNKFLPTKQTSFCHPKGGFQNYCLVGSALF